MGGWGSQVHTLPSPQQPGPGKRCPDSPPPGGGTPGDARAIDGKLSVDGIYHTRSSSTEPVNLSPRPPWRRGWRSAGVETHRLKHEWGPSPMNHACPGAPQANPIQPSAFFLPSLFPIPRGDEQPQQWASRDDCLSPSPRPTCLETQQPSTAYTTRAHQNRTRRAQSDFQSETSELSTETS